MILLDIVEAERRKGDSTTPDAEQDLTRRHAESSTAAAAPSTTDPHLPDYATSQAQAEIQKQNFDSEEDLLKVKAKGKERKLGRVIIWALVIYLVLSLAIALPLFIVLRNNEKAKDYDLQQAYTNGKNGPGPRIGPPPDQLPPDISLLASVYGTPLQCNNWSYSPSESLYQLQYNLPSNETIYIRSNFSELEDDRSTPAMTGTLSVSVTDDPSEENATVSVSMNDVGQEALQGCNVCLMRTDEGWGLTIYVPDDANKDNYFFNVQLTLPLPSGEPHLRSLETYLPSFNQSFTSLDAYMDLESFTVEGSSGGIFVQSVHAGTILVKTTAAEISGTFNSTESCILETILAPIAANVTIYNDGGFCPPSHLDVDTGSSDITLNVTLRSFSNGTEDQPPMYMSKVSTFSGNLQATYQHDPNLPYSTLFVRATNSLNPAGVFVDGAFEGTFDVHTTLAEANVYLDKDLVDPSGAGRQRTYEGEYIASSRNYGWVGWQQRPTDKRIRQGHIEVQSSLNDAILQLTDSPDPNVLNGSKLGQYKLDSDALIEG